MQVEGNEITSIGDTGSFSLDSRIVLTGKSTTEFGHFTMINLYYGIFHEKVENKIEITLERHKLDFQIKLKVHYSDADYVRVEAFSQKDERKYFCLTNPIWNNTT